jgi:predicted nucleic acid-binding protein
MILADSSVWIAHLRGHRTPATATLAAAIRADELLVGDLILLEILQGARDEIQARRLERALLDYPVVSLLDPDLALRAATNYRRLRALGVTIRKTVDLVIGTFCIERGHRLLHADRDFEPMQRHLGLMTA